MFGQCSLSGRTRLCLCAAVDNLPSEIRHHFSELKEKDVMFQGMRVLGRFLEPGFSIVSASDLRRQILKETQGLQKTPATEANVQREDDIARNIGLEYGQAKVLVDEKIDIADRTLALVCCAHGTRGAGTGNQ